MPTLTRQGFFPSHRPSAQDKDELPFRSPPRMPENAPGAPTAIVGRPASESPALPPSRPGIVRTVVVRSARGNAPEEILEDKGTFHEVPNLAPATGPWAKVGVSLGYTIPGPKGSYLSARIDAHVELPCAPFENEVKAAQAMGTSYCKEWLDGESAAVTKLFASFLK